MKDYEWMLANMPSGLDRTVLRVLTYHRGELHLIEREDLLAEAQKQPGMQATEDRQMRESIHELRLSGVRICHSERRVTDPVTGKTSVKFGYYLAKTEDEYAEFRARYGSYARTIWQTIKAMDEKKPVVTTGGELEPPPDMAVQRSLL